MNRAFFLAGGGARGAYQAGVLRAISDIVKSTQLPVQIVSSVSAGSINAAYLAMYANNFSFGTSKLIELWSNLTSEDIFRAGNVSLLRSVLRNLGSMLFHWRHRGNQYLLDTEPLRKLLNEKIDFQKIHQHIEAGFLQSFEVSAMCYDSSETVSFVQSKQPGIAWHQNRQYCYPTTINCRHVLASSAMPLFFPAVSIEGHHYGDGGLRNTAPLNPSIKLGADNILIIGTRTILTKENVGFVDRRGLSFAKILSNVLYAAFADNIDQDIELIDRINNNINRIPPTYQEQLTWRKIKVLYIHPSKNLALLAERQEHALPFFMRYLMNAFGTKEQSSELLSFLLFEKKFCQQLIELGYEDTIKQKENVQRFFE